MLNWNVWNRTICILMNLALNNLQRLICHKIPMTISCWDILAWSCMYYTTLLILHVPYLQYYILSPWFMQPISIFSPFKKLFKHLNLFFVAHMPFQLVHSLPVFRCNGPFPKERYSYSGLFLWLASRQQKQNKMIFFFHGILFWSFHRTPFCIPCLFFENGILWKDLRTILWVKKICLTPFLLCVTK